jgi:hypothetical protein
MALIYAMRLAARAYGTIDLAIQCHDAEQTKHELILPWLMGWFPESSQPTPDAPPPPSVNKPV